MALSVYPFSACHSPVKRGKKYPIAPSVSVALEAICTDVEAEKKLLLRVCSHQGGDMQTMGLARGVIATHWGVSLPGGGAVAHPRHPVDAGGRVALSPHRSPPRLLKHRASLRQ